MSSSVGGFLAPTMITHYLLRTPEEVSKSHDKREFTPLALFSPLLSLAVLFATFMAGEPVQKEEKVIEMEDEVEAALPDESTPLSEKFKNRRRSDGGDFQPKQLLLTKKKSGRPQRRRTLMESARAASVRGSICAPMGCLPDDVWVDDTTKG